MAPPTRTPRAPWIEEAARALAAGGPDAVRVDLLAKALGVTRGGFYWHFEAGLVTPRRPAERPGGCGGLFGPALDVQPTAAFKEMPTLIRRSSATSSVSS
jgi:Bacterial regulatory proteins, tetR family